jgi:TRAP-type uncharacterized transport system fused permease subunit
VALAVLAASGIAKSTLWASSVDAVKMGAAGFNVPFLFVYEPALLMIGDWPTILMSCVTASAGVIFFAAGLHGYFLAPTLLWQRVALIAGGFALIKPGIWTDLFGVAVLIVVAGTQIMSRRAERERVRPAE